MLYQPPLGYSVAYNLSLETKHFFLGKCPLLTLPFQGPRDPLPP